MHPLAAVGTSTHDRSPCVGSSTYLHLPCSRFCPSHATKSINAQDSNFRIEKLRLWFSHTETLVVSEQVPGSRDCTANEVHVKKTLTRARAGHA